MSEQGTTEGLGWHWDVSRGQQKGKGGTGMSEQGTTEGLGWHWDGRAGDNRRVRVALGCQSRG